LTIDGSALGGVEPVSVALEDVRDGNNFKVNLTVNNGSVDIVVPNVAPTSANDSYTTAEDTPLSIAAPGVLGNDSDLDGDSLTAMLVSGVTNGSLTLNSDGSFTYTPNLNFIGSDSFTYKANDGQADSNAATVVITVTAMNDAPVAGDDFYSTSQGQAITVPAPGVLVNDVDPDGDSLTVFLASGVTNGSLTLNSDGSFAYTPFSNFSGTETFVYQASDGIDNSNAASVDVKLKMDPLIATLPPPKSNEIKRISPGLGEFEVKSHGAGKAGPFAPTGFFNFVPS